MLMLSMIFLVFFIFFNGVVGKYDAEQFRVHHLPGLDGPPETGMYSGYITVDEAHGRKLFFAHVEAKRSPETAPVVLWLTGGPGCSSLMAFFDENGPYRPTESLSIELEKYTWNENANMVYLESPAGVGFSKSNDPADYKTGDDRTAHDAYVFLSKFFGIFSQFQGRKFWITGESYGGHYVPELATEILKENGRSSQHINLVGVMVGNGWTFAPIDNRGAALTWGQRALVPMSVTNAIVSECDLGNIGPLLAGVKPVEEWSRPLDESRPTSASCQAALTTADKVFRDVDIYDIYIDECNVKRPVPVNNKGPIFVNPCSSRYLPLYLNRPDVQNALHADETLWTACSSVVDYNRTDVLKRSVIPNYHALLRAKIHVLIYSGDVDAIVPYMGTQDWVYGLNLPTVDPWRSWHTYDEFGKQTGGFVQAFQGLTFATIRDAGHMAPFFRPRRSFHMFNGFLINQTLPK